VSLRVELRTRYFEEDRNSYNVIAEIPGQDPKLRDQVVLIGAHLDSWHTRERRHRQRRWRCRGDGGDAHHPRDRLHRAAPIRVALWSGEEQGLLGARAYLASISRRPPHESAGGLSERRSRQWQDARLLHGREYRRKALFDGWLAPLKDLGATRNIIEGIGSTDHVPFNEAGLPGFNVIKDFTAYDERTRHTNADYPERMTEDALKQSAIVMATVAWQAAMLDGNDPAGDCEVVVPKEKK
jgi:hypothetical protein